MVITLDVRKIQEKAFEFHLALRAWNLHMTSNYDAWRNNFRVSQSFVSFLQKSRIPKSVENHAIKTVIQLENAELYPSTYIPFIVVTVDRSTQTITHDLQKRIGDYMAWVDRATPTNPNVLEMHSHLPQIMYDVHVGNKPGLLAAEEISNAKAWDALWAVKEECNFMFEVIWPMIHRYKPLFEE